MTGDKRRDALDLALRLFQGKVTVTGTTRSGEDCTMVIEDGGAFAVLGSMEDMIAATLAGKEDADG